MFDPREHLMQLKGRDYLQVMWRLVWFRDDKPLWRIETEIVEADQDHAVFRARICDETGAVKSTAHGSESKRDFGDYLEKAETKAVGRALAMLGYGTQFTALELDEGERIVDSPVPPAAPAEPDTIAPGQYQFIEKYTPPELLEKYRRKYGQHLERMPRDKAGEMINYLQDKIAEAGRK